MIKWDIGSQDELRVIQEFKRPVVYLEHWAIRRFAADHNLAVRLTSALEAAQGTWAVSLLNLMEFIPMTDEGQATEFEWLLEQALPNLFFIEFRFLTVMDREKAILQGGPRNAPYGDVELLNVFSQTYPDTPRPFSAKSLVTTVVRNRDRLSPGLANLTQTVIGRIVEMREEMLADKQLENTIKGPQKAAQAQPTWFVLRELLGNLLRDSSKVPTHNDAMDFLHTVVPVTYCDFALLDSQWEHRVSVIRERLAKHDASIKLANVFSEKRGGIERFLKHLENLVANKE